MASIQASLNQLFATTLGAGFALTQTPAVKDYVAKKSELASLKKQQQTLEAAEGQGEIPAEMEEEFRAKGLEAAQKAFELDPNKENYEQLREQLRRNKTISVPAYESPEEYYGTEEYQQEIEKEAANRVYQQNREKDIQRLIDERTLASQQAAQESKQGVQNAVKERRSFLEAMQKERVAFGKGGGSEFGELPTELQKQIASQYSKYERKKVMDKYYGKE